MDPEDEPPKQPLNTYMHTNELKNCVLMHPGYPRLPLDIRKTVEAEGRLTLSALKLCQSMYHDFLAATYIYLTNGINYPLDDGTWLFPTKETPTAE